MTSKNSKYEFVKNFIGLASVNLLSLIIPIITMPYLSRILGAEQYGIVLLFNSVAVFMMIIMDYSTNITGVRACAECYGDKVKTKDAYDSYQNIRLMLGLVYIPIAVIYCLFYIPAIPMALAIELVVVSCIGYYLSAPWFHQGTSTLSFFSIASISTRIVQVAAIFILIKSPASLDYALRLNAYVFLISGFAVYIFRMTRMGIGEKRNNKFSLSKVRSGFDSFVGDFAPNLYSNIPPLLIGATVSPMVFACYSIAMRLVNIAGSFQTIAARSIYPVIVKGGASLKTIMAINITLSMVPFLAIVFFGNLIIKILLGDGYEQAVTYLSMASFSIILFSISCSFTYGYYFPKKKDALFKKISIISSVVPAIFGYPLMYFYDAYGAVMMFVLARMIFCFLYFYHYRKEERKAAITN